MSHTAAIAEPVDSAQAVASCPPATRPRPRWLTCAVRSVYRHSVTRFAVFGAFGLAFDVAVLQVLRITTAMPLLAATTVAFTATYLLNFFLNRTFSFHAHGYLGSQLTRFVPQVTLDYLLTLGGVSLFVWFGLPVVLSRILAGTTNAILNYTAYRWWTFRHRKPSRPSGFSDRV